MNLFLSKFMLVVVFDLDEVQYHMESILDVQPSISVLIGIVEMDWWQAEFGLSILCRNSVILDSFDTIEKNENDYLMMIK